MRELALTFLRLGVTAFGGPAAHIALMENEFVRRQAWLTEEEFLDLVGAANLIPGPGSSEVALYVGQKRAGWRGLILAGACFILPSALIVGLIAYGYVRFGDLPAAARLIYGIKPVIIVVVLQAGLRLGRTAVKTPFLGLLGAAAIGASFAGLNIVILLLAAGLASTLRFRFSSRAVGGALLLMASALTAPVRSAYAAGLEEIHATLARVFLFFLKIGATQFGSGYVLLAYLREDLVTRWHWLTEAQLLDAISIGQFTPGPVFTTATFVGYLLHGPAGAVVATVGIFLPAFLLVATSASFIPRLRKSKATAPFLDGINVASLALMATVSIQLARVALVDFRTVALFLASAAILLRTRVNSAWLVLAGAAIGFLVAP
jgi:chromate transporter